MNKRYYSRLNAALLLIALLASCGDGAVSNDTTASDVTDTSSAPVETGETLDLPDMDWGGREFRVLGYAAPTYTQFSNFEIDSDGENGDVVNDAVYRRNTKIEDTYNVEIVQTLDSSDSNGASATTPVVRKLVLAGEDAYDLVFLPIITCGTIAREGMLYDLNSVDYIDMNKSWWNQTAREDLTVNGKLFLTASDFSLRDKNRAYILLHNRDMVNEFKLTPIIDLVRNGKWTIDTFNQYAMTVANDLNGNGEIDDQDRFGVGLDSAEGFVSIVTGCDVSVLTNENGTPTLTINSERTINVIDKVLEVIARPEVAVMNTDWSGKVDYDFNSFSTKLFKEGRLLFTTSFPHSLKGYSAECVDEYGIVPFPKFDEAQENYTSLVNSYAMLFGIPSTTPEPEFAGFMLEALSHASTDTVLEAYYEISCKTKYTYDADSAEMLDLIFDGLRFEPAVTYAITGNTLLNNIGKSRVNTLTTDYASMESAILADIDKLIEDIDAIN